ncbi:MAG: SpvB/TcaC N-terminal domain-containing protein, partial [Polyangiales bacterium]
MTAAQAEAVSALDGCATTTAASVKAVSPTVTCAGTDTTSNFVVFGYSYPTTSAPTGSDGSVYIPLGPTNSISGTTSGLAEGQRTPPTLFAAGGNPAALVLRYYGLSAPSWTLNGSTVTKTGSTPNCSTETSVGGTIALAVPGTSRVVPLGLDPTAALGNAVLATQTPMLGGTAAAGDVGGSVAVSDTGSATYSVPIALPPGRRGMQPSLSLSYDSSRENGVVGVGWALAGFSAIETCPTTLGKDGTISAAGALCLDGDPLIHTTATNDGWRPQHDPFTRVLQVASTFLVQRRDGRSQTYVAPMVATSAGTQASGAPDRWLLSVDQDLFNNGIAYDYEYAPGATVCTTEPCNAEVRPSRIRYAMDTSTSANSYAKSVLFKYNTDSSGSARADTDARYRNGLLYVASSRLNAIEVHGPMPSTTGVVSTYKLAYTQSPMNGRSLLSSMTMCDGGTPPVCRAPTTFSYEPGNNWFATAKNSDGSDWTLAQPTPRVSSTGFGASAASPPLLVGDLDGDGIDDLLYAYGANWHWYIRLGSAMSAQLTGNAHGVAAGSAPALTDAEATIDTQIVSQPTVLASGGPTASAPFPSLFVAPDRRLHVVAYTLTPGAAPLNNQLQDFVVSWHTYSITNHVFAADTNASTSGIFDPMSGLTGPTALSVSGKLPKDALTPLLPFDLDGDGIPEQITTGGIQLDLYSGARAYWNIAYSMSTTPSAKGFTCGQAPFGVAKWDGVKPAMIAQPQLTPADSSSTLMDPSCQNKVLVEPAGAISYIIPII